MEIVHKIIEHMEDEEVLENHAYEYCKKYGLSMIDNADVHRDGLFSGDLYHRGKLERCVYCKIYRKCGTTCASCMYVVCNHHIERCSICSGNVCVCCITSASDKNICKPCWKTYINISKTLKEDDKEKTKTNTRKK